MNVFAASTQSRDDTRVWSPSRIEAVAKDAVRPDPLALLLAEQRRERTTLRLLLCATAALLILAVGGLLL